MLITGKTAHPASRTNASRLLRLCPEQKLWVVQVPRGEVRSFRSCTAGVRGLQGLQEKTSAHVGHTRKTSCSMGSECTESKRASSSLVICKGKRGHLDIDIRKITNQLSAVSLSAQASSSRRACRDCSHTVISLCC